MTTASPSVNIAYILIGLGALLLLFLLLLFLLKRRSDNSTMKMFEQLMRSRFRR
ncbi:MAG: LPXTG cell wall anchor domain-containing protein [Candidatus Ancillula trichonymphae]|nr:LPXTG cell wall anchor domain-containing protein [Candidatus Ancillula trichonymphae]